MQYNLITMLGPTAGGKTQVAAHLALQLNSCVISADSRQVYKAMDIGTGKDLQDYIIDGEAIPYYLVDICDAGYKYNVYEFQKDFNELFPKVSSNNKIPVLCGGSGLYIEAAIKQYQLISVPVNEKLREELTSKTDDELAEMLSTLRQLHNKTDIDTRKRAIRAIEIELYQKEHNTDFKKIEINSLNIGISFEREQQRKRITERLKARLKSGMIEEVEQLLKKGISPEDLIYYGLEYKFITQYLTGVINREEMFNLLNTAIHQFSKRQMTWFRKMEKEGIKIHWIDGNVPLEEKVERILRLANL
jgi:tRNA dimethylallyltransferase